MYKLMFLLLFSVNFVIPVFTYTHNITFEINIKEGKTKEVTCVDRPVVSWCKGDMIQFDIVMRKEFNDLRRVSCYYDHVIQYTSDNVFHASDDSAQDMQIWKTDTTDLYDHMADTWKCKFSIDKPFDWNGYTTTMGKYNVTEAICLVQFKVCAPTIAAPLGPIPTSQPTTAQTTTVKNHKLQNPVLPSTTQPNTFDVSSDKQQTHTASLWFTGLKPGRLTEHMNELYTDYVYKYTDGEVVNVSCEYKAKMENTTKTFEFYDLSNNGTEMKTIPTTLEIQLTPAYNNSYLKCRDLSGLSTSTIRLILLDSGKNRSGKAIPRKQNGDAPVISLSITQLTQWKWQNTHKCDKMYNYTFTEGNATFDCILDNPTDNEETYRITFYLDAEIQVHSADEAVTKQKPMHFQHTFKLDKTNRLIKCVAVPVKGKANDLLTNTIHLYYLPPPVLNISGSPKLGIGQYFPKNKTTLYNYNFEDGKQVTLECSAKDNKNYLIRFYIANNTRGFNIDKSIETSPSVYKNTFTLKKGHKAIKCVAENYDVDSNLPKYIYSIVYLHCTPPEPPATTAKIIGADPVNVTINGVPKKIYEQGECTTHKDIETTCNYNFTEDLLETEFNLTCVFSGGPQRYNYSIIFGEQKVSYNFQGGIQTKTNSTQIRLKKENTNVKCTAKKKNDKFGTTFTYDINFNYIAPTTLPTKDPLPSSTETQFAPIPAEAPTPMDENDPNDRQKSNWIWAVAACAVILTVFVVVFCSVILCRHKKPPPDESNYANLARDQNNYQTMPLPAPRTLKPGVSQKPHVEQNPNVRQNPNVGQKPNISRKPKAVLETIYNEPKDSQDMSEALYAEPNRYIGESDTYAEPYVKPDNYAQPYAKPDNYAQPYAKPDNYAQPHAASSEGNYAELYAAPQLYATPLPKAQRPPKVIEDEYSNVFAGQYGNTKK